MTQYKDWSTEFDNAVDAYRGAIDGVVTPDPRKPEDFAKEFRDWMHTFKMGGTASLSVLEKELESEDVHSYNTAARLLIELAFPEPLLKLSKTIVQSSKPRLSDNNLRLLWITMPPALSLFKQLSGRWEQLPFVQAVLDQPSADAYMLFNKIVETDKIGFVIPAVEAASRWIEKDQLKRIMEKPPIAPISEDYDSARDARLVAAFYLGLRNDAAAIAFLESIANSNNAIQAAFACNYLAWLAQPGVLKPAEKLLRSKVADATAITLWTSVDIGSPVLIPALLDLVRWKANTQIYSPPICDEALRTLRSIMGYPLDSLSEEYIPESFPSEYSDMYREQVVTLCQRTTPNLQPTRRYHSGKLVTLARLAQNLASPHSSPVHVAAYNLRAITGEDYGFNPDADLITNLIAIEAWKKRAEHSEPLVPGGWAFNGSPLPDSGLLS